jgi:four helix bundle protein
VRDSAFVHSFQSLKVYYRRDAVVAAYEICKALPEFERYGIATQLRRAAVSVKLNIVEGSKRGSDKEFQHFLRIAEASAAEARELLQDIIRLGFDSTGKAERLQLEYAEIGLMLRALRESLK